MSEGRLLKPEEYLGFSLLAEKHPSYFDLALRAQDAKSVKLERQAIGEWLYSIVGGRHRTASFFARIFDDIETLKRGERPE